ncbi:2698_t:CDS:2 [Ambispora gerdemannii]|uniref:2698_t:CDS:1 n=1 Tax=Ambispora gerdemannii TaxID=144530 RepID=A0A9N8YNX1_9GLOM|nr:2698_t:CDS:2 [Ambispora gerdemannii]
MPKIKSKLKTALLKLQQEKSIRDKRINNIRNNKHTTNANIIGSGNRHISKAKHNKGNEKNNNTLRPRPPPYKHGESILLIGEEHILTTGETITATSHDSEELVYEKYEDARENIKILREYGATVLFEIDGTLLEKYRVLKGKRFDKIIFNFPHVGMGIKDKDRNILANQKLLQGFFSSSSKFLKSSILYSAEDVANGEIHVTMKTGLPYDEWNIRKIAKSAGILTIKETIPFLVDHYPGYQHRRTLGFKDGVSKCGNEEILSKNPKTIVFVRKEVVDPQIQEVKKKKAKSESDYEDNY